MYPQVRAEMARKNLIMSDIASHLGITLQTVSAKLSGKSELTVKEACKIRDYLNPEMTLDDMFKRDDA